MAESCHSSLSSLCDSETLRARLEEKENLLLTAAQYGKDLLDQNRELSQNIEDTNRSYTRQMEVCKSRTYYSTPLVYRFTFCVTYWSEARLLWSVSKLFLLV